MTMAKIVEDKRHFGTAIIMESQISRAEFPDWAMAFEREGPVHDSLIAQVERRVGTSSSPAAMKFRAYCRTGAAPRQRLSQIPCPDINARFAAQRQEPAAKSRVMLLTDASDDALYDALLKSDSGYEGQAFVCVTTTGIFCRLSCSARKPRRENVVFERSVKACVDAGFRPCRRCRPLDAPGHPVIGPLMKLLDAEPERRWQETDLKSFGFNPSDGATRLSPPLRYDLSAGGAHTQDGLWPRRGSPGRRRSSRRSWRLAMKAAADSGRPSSASLERRRLRLEANLR